MDVVGLVQRSALAILVIVGVVDVVLLAMFLLWIVCGTRAELKKRRKNADPQDRA